MAYLWRAAARHPTFGEGPFSPVSQVVFERDEDGKWAVYSCDVLSSRKLVRTAAQLRVEVVQAVALGAVAVAYVILGLVSASEVYESVEWPVIVLLGCLIPIGAAFDSSGGTALIAETMFGWTEGLPVVVVVVLLMLITMTLSDVLNNVATAVIAAPIALDLATRLQVNPDAFLMAVAVAASCAFLTPIGHKNNTIIMGPGGYRFGDYWRMGLPLEILVIAVGVPMILLVWPL